MGEQPANAVKAAEEKLHDEQLDWEDFCADKAELEEPVDESDRWVNIQRWVIEDLLDAARTEGRGEALGRIEACINDIKSGICCPRAQGCEQNDGELCLIRQAFARAGLIAPSPQDIQGEA